MPFYYFSYIFRYNESSQNYYYTQKLSPGVTGIKDVIISSNNLRMIYVGRSLGKIYYYIY